MTSADTVECESCQRFVPFDLAMIEYADKGTWWEQRWYYCRDCAPENAESPAGVVVPETPQP